MKRIKVVHLANLDVTLPIHIGNYVRYQRAQGYDVSIICHPGRWLTKDSMIMEDYFVKIIPFEPRITPFADLKSLAKLVRYFKQEQFDIIHTHTVKPSLLGGLAAQIVRAPVIIHTVHGLYLHPSLPKAQYQMFKYTAKAIGALHHSFMSQNRADIQTCIREGICPPEKISFLGNGIDVRRFDPDKVPAEKVDALRAELDIRPDQPVIGIVSRLVREKGIAEFIEAARILKDQGITEARYLIMGTAPKNKPSNVNPEELIAQYDMADQVKLLGFRKDIPEMLALMDIVMYPSHGFEGVPRCLMETAAMATPAVATDVRGCNEAVVDGETGYLVPVRNPPALAKAVRRLLDDPQLREKLGRQARIHALNTFDERIFFWRTDIEYRRLLQARMSVNPNSLLEPVPAEALAKV